MQCNLYTLQNNKPEGTKPWTFGIARTILVAKIWTSNCRFLSGRSDTTSMRDLYQRHIRIMERHFPWYQSLSLSCLTLFKSSCLGTCKIFTSYWHWEKSSDAISYIRRISARKKKATLIWSIEINLARRKFAFWNVPIFAHHILLIEFSSKTVLLVKLLML